jgi:carbamoyl-phosphate synthase large subunit
VLVRPSFVIGGLAIDFCYGPEDLARQLAAATVVTEERPVRIDAYLEGLEVDVDALTDGSEVLIPGLMEHVERAGVHSGDSVAFFPPQQLTPTDQGLIVAAMRRICLEIGVRGLVNAQFIVRDDGVYVLEVNPRASRTVPFLSKVTGVPMVALATRVAGGRSLRELGWRDGLLPPPPLVAVKAPVFSTAKLRGVDPSLGPGMQSTGEVIGLHRDPRVALAKSLLAAALHPPLPGPEGATALISVASRDEHRIAELGAALAAGGYRFVATPGTAAALRRHGHDVHEVAMAGDTGSELPSVLDAIAGGGIDLIVNTPMPRSGAVLDAAAVRHAAVAEGILCMTTMDTAIAAAHALEPAAQARIGDVRSLEAWLAGDARA